MQSGQWLIEHADAVLDSLVAADLDHGQQQQVLELVLSKNTAKTPWELRAAVRSVVLVLFPDHAAAQAAKAERDRDARTYLDSAGVGSLHAHGPAHLVAAMMAALDSLTWPPAPEDPRSAAQRRFDALFDLVTGRATASGWQAYLLVTLATAEGREDLPAEIPGLGPVPASVARQVIADGASLRRVVVDEQGRLVAVEDRVHRPDLPAPTTTPAGSAEAPLPCDPSEAECAPEPGHAEPARPLWWEEPARPEDGPDPDAPSAEDLTWYDDHLDRTSLYAHLDTPAPEAPATPAAAGPDRTASALFRRTPTWSQAGLLRALTRVRTDPLTHRDLTSEGYVVPPRLKRFLVLRDRTCVFPGCPRPATQCDKDHLIPWPRGTTSETNLADECDLHHHAKHAYFTVTRLPDGTFRWTSPTGRYYDRPPRPVLEGWTYRDAAPRKPSKDTEEPRPDSDEQPS